MNIMQPGILKVGIDNQFVDEKSFLVPKYDNYEDEQGRR